MNYMFLRYPGGKAKAVALSYDDGCKDDMRLVETLNRYGIKCTFNLVGSSVEREEPLTKEFIRSEILGKGHEIANHGYAHRGQDLLRPIEGIREILDSRLALERAFGGIIRGMAFPDRNVDRFQLPVTYERVRTYLKELDVTYVRTAENETHDFELPEDWLNWAPTVHHSDPKLFDLIERFLAFDPDKVYRARRTSKIFYLWGHAFEFEHNKNWDLLDAICEKLAGHEDIWYATNGEICDYAAAYRSLVFSADGNTIYNPTLFDLWFAIDGTTYCLRSGETCVVEA